MKNPTPTPPPPAAAGDAIALAARDLARASPPPRGLPFFGLDHRSGSAAELLGGLASHGIFRKYELVLDLSAHLGMSSRWLATVLGCTAVATAASHDEAAAAGALTHAARLADHVHHVAADPRALPFATAGFTHVWSVEGLAFLPDADAALREAFRVVRPGGHLAVQELVPAGGTPAAVAGAEFRDATAWTALLTRTGFVDLATRDVSSRARETNALVATARTRFDGRLAASGRERATLSACLETRRLGLIQILARRP